MDTLTPSAPPTISKDRIAQMRQTMDDSVVMHNLYATDPTFKAKVDMMQPFYEQQSPDWQARFPTFALNKYYSIDPTLPKNPETRTLLSTMTAPQPQADPYSPAGYAKTPGGFAEYLAHAFAIPVLTDPGHISQGISGSVQQAGNDINDQLLQYRTGKQGLFQTGAKVFSDLAGGTANALGSVVSGFLPNFINEGAGMVAKDLANTAPAQAVAKGYSSFAQQHPNVAAGLGAVGNAAKLVSTIAGAENMANQAVGGTTKALDSMANPPEGSALGKMNQTYGGLTRTTPEEVQKSIEQTVGQIVQGDKQSIERATTALQNIDTKGVTTYEGLDQAIQDKLSALKATQDQILAQSPDKMPLDSFNKRFTAGGTVVRSNPVATALDNLKELYAKTGDPQNYVRISNLIEDANANGLSATDVNDIAREYGSTFGSKAFSARSGDPLTSVNAQMYENTRSAVKNAARDLLPDDASKVIDKQMSDLLSTKRNVESMVEKVGALQNKIQSRGFVENVARLVGKGVDLATFHGLRGFLQSFFPSNVGLKVMNSLQLQDALESNLAKLNTLVDKLPSLPDAAAAAAVNEFVTETHTAPLLSLSQNAQATKTPAEGQLPGSSPENVPQTRAPVNSPTSALYPQATGEPLAKVPNTKGFVYHATTPEAAQSILQNGLSPTQGKTFLAPSPDLAAASVSGTNASPVILKIPVKVIQQAFRDPNLPKGVPDFYITHPIPGASIQRLP